MECEAIVLTTGRKCTRNAIPDGRRCKVHTDSMIRHGPHTTQRKELKAIYQKLDLQNLMRDTHAQIITIEEYWQRRIELTQKYRTSLTELLNNQSDQILQTGIDPDEGARIRKRERVEQLRLQRHQRLQELVQRVHMAENQNDLAKFVADPQNIHTTLMVEQTKKMIEKVRSVSVPEEYRWNTQACSKTPGEIILSCKLSPDAAWQMMSKYTNPEPIYDIEEGIYGKVLDSVWQYVINSPEKESLIAIVKSEMEDNIGMCAQGNLTRICNILSGYMEGVGPTESPVEVLGRLMPKVAEIDDTNERLNEATRVLQESGLPTTEWMNWTVVLFPDEVIDVRDNKLVLV